MHHSGAPVRRTLTRIAAAALAAALGALFVLVPVTPADAAEFTTVIDFESGLSPGDMPSTLEVGTGLSGADLGTISVSGTNPALPGNSAMIFDSSCAGQTVPISDPTWDPSQCSGGDSDLYIPGQGNTLIITEDGDSSDPDDKAGPGGFFTFDFSSWADGTVTFKSLTVIDLEDDENTAEVRFFDPDGNPIGTIPIVPTGGDNTTATTIADMSGVGSLVFFLDNSGAIDDFVISTDVTIIDLELDKTVDEPSVLVGEQVTFTVSVTNQGPDDATGVEVTDALPAGMTYVSHSTLIGTFDPVSLLWEIGDLAVDATVTLDLTVSVDESGTFVNESEVTAANEEDLDSTPNDDEGDDWDDETVTAEEPPAIIDLELDKSASPTSVLVGDNTTFTITLTNQGPDDATAVAVTDALPAGLTYVSHSTAAGSFDPVSLVWTVGEVAVSDVFTLDITATVDQVGTFVNEAEVTAANEEDSDSTPGDGEGDDWDDATVSAQEPPQEPIMDLELIKTVDDNDVLVGDAVTFTVSVTNQGPNDASGVEVTDTLPTGLNYVSHSTATGVFDTATMVWTIGDLAVGTTVTLDLSVTVDEAGDHTNVAEVTDANEDDSDSTPNDGEGDDWDDETVSAQEPPAIIDLELPKTVDDNVVSVDDQVTFTITVTNQGPDDATGVEVTDTLPTGLTYVSHSTATGVFDATTVVWTIGAVDVGDVFTLDLIATVDEAGVFTNEAEVTEANEEDVDSVPNDGEGDDWDDETVEASEVLASGTIGDYVWFDDDRDGLQDADENGVSGVSIRLMNTATSAVSTTTTNSDGLYLFSAVEAGTYTVQIIMSTAPEMTTLTTTSSHNVTLPDGGSFLDADFGLAGTLPVTGMEIRDFGLAGTLFLLAGIALLIAGRRRETSAI